MLLVLAILDHNQHMQWLAKLWQLATMLSPPGCMLGV